MQKTPLCNGAYVALQRTGVRFCNLRFGSFQGGPKITVWGWSNCLDYSLITRYKPLFHHFPIDNLPQCLQVGWASVLVVEIVGVLPDVESEDGAEPMGDGVVGAGVRVDGQSAGRICMEPDPAGAEKGGAFLDEVNLEGVDGPPLFDDLGDEGRFLDFGFACARNDRRGAFACNDTGGPELGKVEIVIQDLTGVVKNGTVGMADDVLQRHGLELSAGNEFVQVVHITFQVLAVVEFKSSAADDWVQCVYRVR